MSATKTKKAPYPFTVNDTYISLVVDGRPFSLNETHPTFEELRSALIAKRWSKVPHLVTIAAVVSNKSHGAVTVNRGGVYYKSREVDSSLTRRITYMLKENYPMDYMLKFMDNLYSNPSDQAISELFDFLSKNDLPITDDGCFMAYKMVNQDYTDCHTSKFDNSPGQVLVMKRSDVDSNRQETCSRGFHFCSVSYLSSTYGSGGRLMQVKINPKDVVSIPPDYNFAKGRTWRYEVVKEISDNRNGFDGSLDHPSMLVSVVPVAKERKTLLENILNHKTVKRAIYRGKWRDKSIRKWNYGQLAKFWNRLPHPLSPAEQSKLFQNTLRVIREQAGISLKEISEELDLSYKAVWAAERSNSLRQTTVDRYIEAIELIKVRRNRESEE